MTEAFLFPHISSQIHITPRSRTLIDNIFSNNIEHDTLSGNITTTISDHFAQFLILKNLSHKQDLKKDIKNDYEKLFENKIHFESDWKSTLQLRENDPSTSSDIFITTIKNVIIKHAPLKKLSTKENKNLYKPWTTKGILTSIKKKNQLNKKYRRMKDPIMRPTEHDQYKFYRNDINKITRLSKANHYKKFLEDNKTKLLKVWGGIKEIIRTKVTSKKAINSIK